MKKVNHDIVGLTLIYLLLLTLVQSFFVSMASEEAYFRLPDYANYSIINIIFQGIALYICIWTAIGSLSYEDRVIYYKQFEKKENEVNTDNVKEVVYNHNSLNNITVYTSKPTIGNVLNIISTKRHSEEDITLLKHYLKVIKGVENVIMPVDSYEFWINYGNLFDKEIIEKEVLSLLNSINWYKKS